MYRQKYEQTNTTYKHKDLVCPKDQAKKYINVSYITSITVYQTTLEKYLFTFTLNTD